MGGVDLKFLLALKSCDFTVGGMERMGLGQWEGTLMLLLEQSIEQECWDLELQGPKHRMWMKEARAERVDVWTVLKLCIGTSLVVHWLRICLPTHGMWVRSLVLELSFHMLWGN